MYQEIYSMYFETSTFHCIICTSNGTNLKIVFDTNQYKSKFRINQTDADVEPKNKNSYHARTRIAASQLTCN